MEIKNQLKNLGLNEKEADTYLTLLKNGPSSPSNISKLTKINRATVYNICDSLKGKGLIDEDVSSKSSLFYCLETSSLEKMFDQDKKEIEEKVKVARKIKEDLNMLNVDKKYPTPKIRFIEHENIDKFLRENIDKWQSSLKDIDSTWWGIQDHSFPANFKDFGDWYWLSNKNKGFQMQLVGNESVDEDYLNELKKPNRNVPLVDDLDFSSSVWVGGDYIMMLQTRTKPFYMFEIHDKALASNLRPVFKKLWKGYQKK